MCGYFNLGLYDESIDFGVKGLRLAQESVDDQLLLLTLGNIAFNYYALEKYEEAKELFALAEQKQLVLLEGVKTAYMPAFCHLITMIKSGLIGDVVDIDASVSVLKFMNVSLS